MKKTLKNCFPLKISRNKNLFYFHLLCNFFKTPFVIRERNFSELQLYIISHLVFRRSSLCLMSQSNLPQVQYLRSFYKNFKSQCIYVNLIEYLHRSSKKKQHQWVMDRILTTESKIRIFHKK